MAPYCHLKSGTMAVLESHVRAAQRGYTDMFISLCASTGSSTRHVRTLRARDALKRIASNGVRTIIVETASRFARDLIVAETGFRRLRDAGITLIAADGSNSFLDDTPTSAFIRQVLAAVQELDKAMIVSKLKGARQRKRATGVKVEGRKSYGEAVPATVERAKALKAEGLTLRQVADRLASEGYQTRAGTPYQFTAVGRMISGRTR